MTWLSASAPLAALSKNTKGLPRIDLREARIGKVSANCARRRTASDWLPISWAVVIAPNPTTSTARLAIDVEHSLAHMGREILGDLGSRRISEISFCRRNASINIRRAASSADRCPGSSNKTACRVSSLARRRAVDCILRHRRRFRSSGLVSDLGAWRQQQGCGLDCPCPSVCWAVCCTHHAILP